ncbi:MAG: hypothetical protein FJ278_12680, partial [Planctomycetes bacterium]|nr:hypothetical protein [Planctomycetota bacterium]
MLKKSLGWVVVGGLTGVVAVGLWGLLSRGVSPERRDLSASQGTADKAVAIQTAVPAEVVPASGPTQEQAASPLAPLLSGSPPTPTADVQSGPPSAATPEPVPPAPVPDAVTEPTVDPSVARFVDASIPVETRSAEVEQLGKSGDANAVRTLMKLGDTSTYLNFKAVEALGNVKTPEVALYLEGKAGDA